MTPKGKEKYKKQLININGKTRKELIKYICCTTTQNIKTIFIKSPLNKL